jgi:glycosyltransferase involved in cell wall biosynthesis
MLVHLVTDRLHTGGGVEHIFQITRGLPDMSFRVFAAPGDADGKFAGLANVEACPGGYRPSRILKGDPDVVHIHHLRPLLAFFANPLRKYGVPIIYTAHGLHLHKYEFIPGSRSRLAFGMRLTLEKYLLKRADQVIAVSREDRDYIAERYGIRRVRHIANGIEPPPEAAGAGEREDVAREFQLPVNGPLCLTVARFDFQKGQDILLRAIALARGALAEKNARFLLAGEGNTLAEMKGLASRLGISDLVRFLGNRSDARRLMRAADIVILPSRWEGLPIVLLEAGLMRVPVIAAATYGSRELLTDDRGVSFAPGDASDLANKLRGAVGGEFDLAARAENLYRSVRRDYGVQGFLAAMRDLYETARSVKNGQTGN